MPKHLALAMLIAGIIGVVMGVGLLSVAGALIVGGVILMALAVSEALGTELPGRSGRPKGRRP